MKKLVFGMIAIASMAMMGCTQEIEQIEMNDMKNVKLIGTIEDVKSRTLMDNTGKVIWCQNDPISVFMRNGSHYKYQSKTSGTANTTFEYAGWCTEGAVKLNQNYAVYPFAESNSFDASSNTFTVDLSGLGTQIYTENNFEERKSVMTAKASNTNLPFYNALSMLNVRLNTSVPDAYRIKNIKIESSKLALQGSGATIDMSGDGKVAAVLTSGENSITLNCANGEDEGVVIGTDYTDFHILVPATPVEANDFKITITAIDEFTGEVYTKEETIADDFTFERSKIVTYKRTLTADDWTGNIEDEAFPHEVDATTITNAFISADGTDIKENISNIVFGNIADYTEIVENYTATVTDGVSVYQVINDDNTYTIYYLSESKIVAPANSKSLFQDMKNMTTFDATNLDMSQVENALGMFANCTNLVSIEGSEDWDMSNATNIQSIFYGCNKLEDIDVSNWDTSNVTTMRMVFFRCYKLSDEVLKGVENWDVSNVTTFYSMFKHAYGLTSLDLSKWDTSNAVNMSHMFANIGANLSTLDLSGFDTSKVTDMSWMFYGDDKLTTIYVGDGWSTESHNPENATCFYNNQALKGGEGTTWLDVCDMANANRPWESSAKIDYAIVDGGADNPGLLTYKSNN